MPNKIETSLSKLFENHRVVFWYDSKKELRDDFDSINIDGVNKEEINNNEFGLKYQILREKSDEKFLLYKEDAEPSDPIDNWLLDVQLAHYVYSADQQSIWLEELGLGPEYRELINTHSEFFKAVGRINKLKKILNENDTKYKVKLKMLSVCANADEIALDSTLEYLLKECSEEKDEKINLIKRCQLFDFLFDQIYRNYQYQSNNPSIKDFCIHLFDSSYKNNISEDSELSLESSVFINRWKDSRSLEKSFSKMSVLCAETLGIESDLNDRDDFTKLLDIDIFEIIDKKIISELITKVVNRTITAGEVSKHIHKRAPKHYYIKYKSYYKAIESAAHLLLLIDNAKLKINSFSEGIELYSSKWFSIDQLYRKYIFHQQNSKSPSLMNDLTELVENFYSNKYLLELNNQWQSSINRINLWDDPAVSMQKNFFKDNVKPFLDRNKKIVVIISDAMRYEVGSELVKKINNSDRFSSTITPAVSMLPSYTQLGMAALLPNNDLEIANDTTGAVKVDGISSQGVKNRSKILNKLSEKKAECINAPEFLKMDKNQQREVFSKNEVLYIYHNLIDQVGDKRESEDRVFKASKEALEEIVQLVKALTNANASNLLITADHGFIYQNRELPESDFSSSKIDAENILYKNRRFVIGNNFSENESFKIFKTLDLGLLGGLDVAIPNSINRIRVKGSGSRFVHGGSSLQEIVIPVIKVNKSRTSDLSNVEIEVIKGPSNLTITTSQLSVVLYQIDAISDKTLARSLRVGIYTKDNKLISDSHDLQFDFDLDNPREREIPVRFILTREADNIGTQEVELRLEEKESGTNHYKTYKKVKYTLRKAFTADFDL